MDESTQTKLCTGCGETKPLSEFHRRKPSKDGRCSRCKVCRRSWNREYMKTYTHPDPEAEKARRKRYMAAHVEELRAHRKRYEERHADVLPERAKAYREANAERLRQAKAAYHAENAERIRANVKQWQAENRDRFHASMAKRRARIAETRMEVVDLEALWTGDCALCGEPIDIGRTYPDPLSKSVDHIVPLSKGGTHTQDNLQWAHLVCNHRKGAS